MKLFTTRGAILNVAKKWRRTYGADGSNLRYEEIGMYVIARALERLDANTATPEEVEEIIGNGSWTQIICNECKGRVEAAVQLGDEPDYESSTATICFDCIHAAHKLFPLGTFKS